MKQIKLFALTILLGFCSIANAGVIVLEGNYMGKNIFVKNPFGGAGVGFCVFEVTINGKQIIFKTVRRGSAAIG